MLGFLQRIGKSLMLPIAVLPAAGLILRFGQEDLLDIPFLAASGNAIFANLALIFAIGVAVGWAKDNSGAAGLAGVVGYLVLTNGTQAINPDINMGALGGIIAGLVSGALYNRFHNIKLPDYLGFFSGRRFVPIITSVTMLVLAFAFGYVWPPIQDAIHAFGNWIISLGSIGAGIFGFVNRLLIPIGLHHVVNTLFWFDFGSFTNAAGEVVKGDIARFFAGDKTAGLYMTGFFPIMMFGLPAAALAMIATAKPERRKATAGMLISLGLTAFITGITEPIEFSFMFLAPALYGLHAVLTGTSLALTAFLGIKDGFTFSAGGIDFLLNFNIATKPWLLLLVGLIYGVIYFVLFYFLIRAFNIKTPGREDEADEIEVDQEGNGSGDKYAALSARYMEALGGRENLSNIDNCVTRLRLKVNDMDKVNEAELKKIGAKGVIKLNKTDLQVIVGTDVEFVADHMRKM
ncbi:N-acetylglucosamine-specific PTS transporter subunit IIBC [Bacillus testis]|uniref:N-acetylglucosamine-specific PTS transporter subunit IIBC n=1 Tax=Bacillus testis TaxID=1622072 RepID=UPI00067EDE5A|nr:N-acetylglucosamine-specific PTS transporter subunit IIBC [Bacillus testis]